mgnify:CR=1 FL=1
MNTLKLKIVGMHCESCEKALKKALLKTDHIQGIDLKYNNEIATIHYNPEININEVINVIRQVGYDATVVDKDYVSSEIKFKHYLQDLKQKHKAEGQLLGIAVSTLLILGFLEVIAYFGFFKNIPNFFNAYGYYLIFLVISVVLSATSIWHIKAYGNVFSCMSGMMIGMTTGMISGFLIGMLVGATNGMFMGSVLGILVGMVVGVFTGKCCGVMGTMEGMMAGFMGGLMGAMTSLMLLNDHLKLIIPILVVASAMIMIGLDYMIYKEATNTKEKLKKYSFIPFVTFCFIITIGITFVMVYGPKSVLFR